MQSDYVMSDSNPLRNYEPMAENDLLAGIIVAAAYDELKSDFQTYNKTAGGASSSAFFGDGDPSSLGIRQSNFSSKEDEKRAISMIESMILGGNGTNDSSAVDPDLADRLWEIYSSFKSSMNVSDVTVVVLVVLYSILILVGTIGNLLVVTAVVRKESMRTPRNLFIFNLAVSDIILCVVTMPLTLMEIIYNNWTLGDFFCKMTGMLEPISIFVSTLSITVIAVDRCYIILNPTKASVQQRGALVIMASIWAVSVGLGIPLFIHRKLHVFDVDVPGLLQVPLCLEDWNHPLGRGYYSIASMILIYLVPITTVSLAYKKIGVKLRNRLGNKIMNRTSTSRKAQLEDQKITRTNKLLASMAIAFCLSWFPLNFFNVLDDFEVIPYPNKEVKFTLFAVCHMIGMMSACINPVLYGYLNENFRKEFREMFAPLRAMLPGLGSGSSRRDRSLDSKRSTWIRETMTNNALDRDGGAGDRDMESGNPLADLEVASLTPSSRRSRTKSRTRFRIFDTLLMRRRSRGNKRVSCRNATGNGSGGGGSVRGLASIARSKLAATPTATNLCSTTTATRIEMGLISRAQSTAGNGIDLDDDDDDEAGHLTSECTTNGRTVVIVDTPRSFLESCNRDPGTAENNPCSSANQQESSGSKHPLTFSQQSLNNKGGPSVDDQEDGVAKGFVLTEGQRVDLLGAKIGRSSSQQEGPSMTYAPLSPSATGSMSGPRASSGLSSSSSNTSNTQLSGAIAQNGGRATDSDGQVTNGHNAAHVATILGEVGQGSLDMEDDITQESTDFVDIDLESSGGMDGESCSALGGPGLAVFKKNKIVQNTFV